MSHTNFPSDFQQVLVAAPVKRALAQGVVAGSLAAGTSTIALMALGRRQAGSAAAPVNAVSHWYWGGKALRTARTDVSHTALGYLTHHGAAVFWATLYAAVSRNMPSSRSLPGVAVGSLATSAVACLVDYQLTPKRLTPGFEHHLSRSSMAVVYAAFAAGLAAGAFIMRDSYSREDNGAAASPERGAGRAPSEVDLENFEHSR
jgi:hypothetical protein